MKDLYIKEIDKQDHGYLALIQEKGGIFNDPAWLDLFGSRLRLYGIFAPPDLMVGAFSLYHTRICGLKYIKNPITTPHCGLIYRNEPGNRYKRNSHEKAIHTCIADFLRALKPAIIQFNLPPEVADAQPYLWKGFKVSPTYTYRLDLGTGMQDIFSQFNGKLRSDISKSQKDAVRVERTEDRSLVRDLVKKTFVRQKISISFELIDKILDRFSAPDNSFAFIAWQEDHLSAASFCVHDKTTAYYILGGYDQENRQRGAGSAALLASIEYARELGLQTFDFEGSMIPAIESFFRGFGGELTVKFSVHRAWLPVEMVLKMVKREVY